MTVTKVTRSHNRGRASATNFTSETLLNRGNVDSVQMGVADGALGLILDMLTDISANCGAYAVRETYSNAQDAIRGMKNGRIDITLSTKDDTSGVVARILKNKSYDDTYGCFTISDNGIGMSADDVRNLFLQYGGSNKRDNADSIGSKGLGSKAPLAITDNFMVVTVKNGVETVVNIHRDGDNNSADIQSCSTDKPNGTSVIVPVMSYETYDQIKNCIKVLEDNNYDTNLFVNGEPAKKIVDNNDYISSVIKINDTDSVQIVVSATDLLEMINGRWDKLSQVVDNSYHYYFDAVIGGYPYSLNTTRYSYWKPDTRIMVFMQPGFFDFTPSRDEIVQNNAFKDFLDVLMNEWYKNVEDIANKAALTVANDDSRSIIEKVTLINAGNGHMPNVSLPDNVFDNAYKLTSMLSNEHYITTMENDAHDDLNDKRDKSIPRYFMIEKFRRYYRTILDTPRISDEYIGNMNSVVSYIADKVRDNNGAGLDNLFYTSRNSLKTIVIYNGKTDDYMEKIRTFGCVTRAVGHVLGKDWQNARYIFLMDTDKITDDIRDIINLSGIKVGSSAHKLQETEYYQFNEILTMVDTYHKVNKSNRNNPQPKNLNVIMFDKNKIDTNPYEWELGSPIKNINDITDGLIVFANKSTNNTDGESMTSRYSNSIKKALKLATNTTKGYLVLDAKANTVTTIMKNKNLHVLADHRTRINKNNRYTNEYTTFYLDDSGHLFLKFDYFTTQNNNPVYQQLYRQIRHIISYSGTNCFEILANHYTNKTNPTETDKTINTIIQDTLNIIETIKQYTNYNINFNPDITVPQTEQNKIITTLIETINTTQITTLNSIIYDDDDNKDILTNALVEIVTNKLNKSITEYREQHDQTTN